MQRQVSSIFGMVPEDEVKKGKRMEQDKTILLVDGVRRPIPSDESEIAKLVADVLIGSHKSLTINNSGWIGEIGKRVGGGQGAEQ